MGAVAGAAAGAVGDRRRSSARGSRARRSCAPGSSARRRSWEGRTRRRRFDPRRGGQRSGPWRKVTGRSRAPAATCTTGYPRTRRVTRTGRHRFGTESAAWAHRPISHRSLPTLQRAVTHWRRRSEAQRRGRVGPSGGGVGARAQWRKWRSPVKTMARPCSSAAAMASSSRTEPPGWMTAATPDVGDGVDAVPEREEGVAGTRAAGGPPGGLLHRDARRVEPVLLPGPDADRLAALHQHDGVRADGGAHPPRQLEVDPLLLGRRDLGDHTPGRRGRCPPGRPPAPAPAVDGAQIERRGPGRRRRRARGGSSWR